MDILDERFQSSPLGWALHGWQNPAPEGPPGAYPEVVALLVRAGAKVDPAWLEPNSGNAVAEKVRADARMRAALTGG